MFQTASHADGEWCPRATLAHDCPRSHEYARHESMTPELAMTLSIIPIDVETIEAYVATSTVSGGKAIIDAHASPAEATATARVLLDTPHVAFSHLGMGAWPVYVREA